MFNITSTMFRTSWYTKFSEISIPNVQPNNTIPQRAFVTSLYSGQLGSKFSQFPGLIMDLSFSTHEVQVANELSSDSLIKFPSKKKCHSIFQVFACLKIQ